MKYFICTKCSNMYVAKEAPDFEMRCGGFMGYDANMNRRGCAGEMAEISEKEAAKHTEEYIKGASENAR